MRNNSESFANILIAYGLDQQRRNNIEIVVESYRSEIEVLAYQQEQKRHFKVAKKEPKKINEQNLDTRLTKKKQQECEHQTFDSIVIKDEIENQGSKVDVWGS